jgi:transglutaminase-like putative cysteine protease
VSGGGSVSIQVSLFHQTSYRYDRRVTLGPQTVRLRPAPHTRTTILAYSLKVDPAEHFLNWQQDPQGNFLARLVFPEKVDRFTVTVALVADMAVVNPFDFFLEPAAETFPFTYDHTLDAELASFRKTLPAVGRFGQYVAGIKREKMRTIDFLVAINQKLQQDIRYIVRMEPGVQTPEETLTRREGSCRDTGWLLVQLMRHLGLAARFVSGYLIQLVADQKPIEGPAGPTADFTDLHAWCEVYLPGAGWIGLDPTSGLFAGEGHIPLACSPEPQSAAPISGMVEDCEAVLHHEMSVHRFAETPRVTKPYDDAAWAKVMALGQQVDRDLVKQDVRLTMGGEPTFVAAADPDGAEWNTEALGPTKRVYAGKLLRRLATRFGSGNLLHYGQGKWYPGEQLPRWALTCHWRKDGEPIWRNHDLFAADEDADKSLGPATSRDFIMRLAERL